MARSMLGVGWLESRATDASSQLSTWLDFTSKNILEHGPPCIIFHGDASQHHQSRIFSSDKIDLPIGLLYSSSVSEEQLKSKKLLKYITFSMV